MKNIKCYAFNDLIEGLRARAHKAIDYEICSSQNSYTKLRRVHKIGNNLIQSIPKNHIPTLSERLNNPSTTTIIALLLQPPRHCKHK